MEEVLKSEISKIKELVEMKKDLISDEMAFNFLILQYFCYNSKNFHDNIIFINDNITDEKNDGGIDFVYFDEDESKIIIGPWCWTTDASLSAVRTRSCWP